MFAMVLKSWREDRGLSQELLAQRIGASPPAVRKWEQGAVLPNFRYVVRIARVLDVDIRVFARAVEEGEALDMGSPDDLSV